MKKKSKKEEPIGYYIGTSPLEGKVIKSISIGGINYPTHSFTIDWTVTDSELFHHYFEDKKTLCVTKKEDIKFE